MVADTKEGACQTEVEVESAKEQESPIVFSRKGKGKTNTVGTQTERNEWRRRNDASEEKIRRGIEAAQSLYDLKETLKEKWQKKVFRAVREVEGNPLKQDKEMNLTFWKGKGVGRDSGIYRQMAVRFPDLVEITEKEWISEETLCWVYDSRRDTNKGPLNCKRRTITSLNIGETENDIYKSLLDWKKELEEHDIKRVAFPIPKTDWEKTKKILKDTEIIARAYHVQAVGDRKATANQETQSTQQGSTNRARPKEKEDVIIVTTRKPYVEALKQIKQSINIHYRSKDQAC